MVRRQLAPLLAAGAVSRGGVLPPVIHETLAAWTTGRFVGDVDPGAAALGGGSWPWQPPMETPQCGSLDASARWI
jgi:hypothetical protein